MREYICKEMSKDIIMYRNTWYCIKILANIQIRKLEMERGQTHLIQRLRNFYRWSPQSLLLFNGIETFNYIPAVSSSNRIEDNIIVKM